MYCIGKVTLSSYHLLDDDDCSIASDTERERLSLVFSGFLFRPDNDRHNNYGERNSRDKEFAGGEERLVHIAQKVLFLLCRNELCAVKTD